MQANNGLQDHSGFAGEQAMNVNYGHPATLVQNTYATVMGQPITYGNNQPQQQSVQGPPQIASLQQVVNINGALYVLPLQVPTDAIMASAQGDTQRAQQAPRNQPAFVNQQVVNNNGWTSDVTAANEPNAADTAAEFNNAYRQQPVQVQSMQNYQHTQRYQGSEQYQYGQNHQPAHNHQRAQSYHGSPNYQIRATNHAGYEINSGHNTLNGDQFHPSANYTPPAGHGGAGSPPQAQGVNHRRAVSHPQAVYARQAVYTPQAVNTPQTGYVEAGPAKPLQSSLGTEITDEFRDHVKDLLGEKATTFQARIRNKNDYVRYRQAVWETRLKGGNHKNKCDDYPKDEAGELKVTQRIFEAIVNVDGEQDPATDTGGFANCLAVKTIQGLSEIDVELLAHDFMENMRRIQSGERVLDPEAKIVQENTFMEKVAKVEAALRVNKLLCRSATMNDNWVSRIAADPSGERRQKVLNIGNNMKKGKVLAAESLKNGTAKKGMPKKGKGKRAATAEPEAEPSREATAEASDAVVASQASA